MWLFPSARPVPSIRVHGLRRGLALFECVGLRARPHAPCTGVGWVRGGGVSGGGVRQRCVARRPFARVGRGWYRRRGRVDWVGGAPAHTHTHTHADAGTSGRHTHTLYNKHRRARLPSAHPHPHPPAPRRNPQRLSTTAASTHTTAAQRTAASASRTARHAPAARPKRPSAQPRCTSAALACCCRTRPAVPLPNRLLPLAARARQHW